MSRIDTDRGLRALVAAVAMVFVFGAFSRASAQGINWTGGYIGGHIGTANGSVDTTFDPLPTAAIFINFKPTTLTVEPKGAVFGGQAGFNYQSGHIVVGGEGVFSISKMDKSASATPIIQNDGTPYPGTGFISAGQKTTWMLHLRPRIGAQAGQAFIYGALGLSFVKIEDSAEVDFRPAGTEDYAGLVDVSNKRGWHWGAGVEVAASKVVSVFGEFMSYRFPVSTQVESQTVDPTPAFPPYQMAFTWTSQPTTVLRGGVNFRF